MHMQFIHTRKSQPINMHIRYPNYILALKSVKSPGGDGVGVTAEGVLESLRRKASTRARFASVRNYIYYIYMT